MSPREQIVELSASRALHVWVREVDGWTRLRFTRDRDAKSLVCSRHGGDDEIEVEWSNVAAVEAVDGHFHLAFPASLPQTVAPSDLFDAVCRCFFGAFDLELSEALRQLPGEERDAWRQLAFDVLERGTAPLRAVVLALGPLGDEQDALRLGDFVTRYTGFDEWPVLYALEALRMMGRRDANMQLQRVSYQAALPHTISLAQSRLIHVASELRTPVWEVQDELVPTCGLDGSGSVALSYGSRNFELELNRHLTPLLVETPGWTRHAQLPEPAPDDDDALVAQSETRWAVIREQLLEAIPVQLRRFEDALAQQVRWEPNAWHRNVREHPLLVHLAPRAIWGTYVRRGRRLSATFRITTDREIWGPDDEPFEFPDDEFTIGLVHPVDLNDEIAAAWGTQLADYEIATMFPQIDRSFYRPEKPRDSSVQLDISAPQQPALTALYRAGWSDIAGKLRKVFRRHDVVACLDQWSDGTQLKLRRLTFERHLDYPKYEFELRDVPKIVFSEAMYEVEMLRGPQQTGGWAAVTT